jgi:hypothetical protein
VLIPLHDLLLGNELRHELAHSPVLWFTFGSLAASHFWKAFWVGYDTMPDKELKQRVRWDLYLLILRAIAMFFMAAHGLYFVLVPLMALLLSYLETWPKHALGAVFRDPSRLWEYDPGDPTSKRRCPDARASATRHSLGLFRALRCEFSREMSDRHRPSKLIKNQNASTINADKLKAKMSEIIISSAPAAFINE